MAYLELNINKGDTFASNVYITNALTGNVVNISGYTARASMRRGYKHANSTPFTITIADTPNGRIQLSMTAANTGNLVTGGWVYDVETVNGTTVTRVQEGRVFVSPEATW